VQQQTLDRTVAGAGGVASLGSVGPCNKNQIGRLSSFGKDIMEATGGEDDDDADGLDNDQDTETEGVHGEGDIEGEQEADDDGFFDAFDIDSDSGGAEHGPNITQGIN